ncbi:hypothetical protein AMTRI_Chr10g7030 [Amborella trichopoda]
MKYMAFSRFICILLLGLLFATVELASSSVVALQVVALDKTQEIKVPIADENLAVQRGVMVESKGLKGRKMAMKETVMKKKTGAEDKNHVASRISGSYESGPKEFFDAQQVNRKSLGTYGHGKWRHGEKSKASLSTETGHVSEIDALKAMQVAPSASKSSDSIDNHSPLSSTSRGMEKHSQFELVNSSKAKEDLIDDISDMFAMDYHQHPSKTPPVNNNKPQSVSSLHP